MSWQGQCDVPKAFGDCNCIATYTVLTARRFFIAASVALAMVASRVGVMAVGM